MQYLYYALYAKWRILCIMVDTRSHEVELHYAYNFQAQLLSTLLSTCAFHAGFVLPLCFCVSTTCIYFLHAYWDNSLTMAMTEWHGIYKRHAWSQIYNVLTQTHNFHDHNTIATTWLGTSHYRLSTNVIQVFFWTPFNASFKRNKDVNPTRNVCIDQFTVSSLDRLPLLYTWSCTCVCMKRGV